MDVRHYPPERDRRLPRKVIDGRTAACFPIPTDISPPLPYTPTYVHRSSVTCAAHEDPVQLFRLCRGRQEVRPSVMAPENHINFFVAVAPTRFNSFSPPISESQTQSINTHSPRKSFFMEESTAQPIFRPGSLLLRIVSTIFWMNIIFQINPPASGSLQLSTFIEARKFTENFPMIIPL